MYRPIHRILLVSILWSPIAGAAEWNQYGGPERDFRLARFEISSDWTGWGLLWERDLGPGYSGIVTDGQRLITMTRAGDDEVVVALDRGSGRTLWRHAYPAPIPTGDDATLDTSWGEGPNGTPLVSGGRVYSLGFTGILSCLDIADGRLLWRRDLVAEEGIQIPFFGLSTSPIRFADTVIVLAGGARAFRLESGEPVWENEEFESSYASPVLLDRDGDPTLVAGVAGAVVGLRPADGGLRWRHDHSNDYDTILSSPVIGDNGIVFASAYFLGSIGLEIGEDGAGVRELWENPRLQLSYTNAVRAGRAVYGFHNRILKAVDVVSGELMWQSRDVERGNLVAIGDRHLLLDRTGELSLLSLTESGVVEHARAQILEGRSWTAPALSGTTLYARNLEKIVAIDLARIQGTVTASALRDRARERERVRAPDTFLQAKRRLIDATLTSDRSELRAAAEELEPWLREADPLAPLAHYYLGLAAFHEAELVDDDVVLALLRRAEDHFTDATRLDRDFAEAHAFLGRIFPMYYRYDPQRAAVVGPLGGEHADTARRLEPDNPRVLAFGARSLFYRPAEHGGDRVLALEMMRGALEMIDSAPADASRAEPDWGRAELWVWYGQMLARLEAPEGGAGKASEAYRRALEIEPRYARARELFTAVED